MHVVFVENLEMPLFIFMEESPVNAKAPSTSQRCNAAWATNKSIQRVFHWLLLCPLSELASSALGGGACRPTLLDCRKVKWKKYAPKPGTVPATW